jgi:hypothetical protein
MSASINGFTETVKNVRLGKLIYGGGQNRFTEVRLRKSAHFGGPPLETDLKPTTRPNTTDTYVKWS